MVKKNSCKFKHKGKCFKTKFAKGRYVSWNPIIKKARKDKAPKNTVKMMKNFQKSWVGK